MCKLKYVPEEGSDAPYEKAEARFNELHNFIGSMLGCVVHLDDVHTRCTEEVVEVWVGPTDHHGNLRPGCETVPMFWWEDGTIVLDWPFTKIGVCDMLTYEIEEAEAKGEYGKVDELREWRQTIIATRW